MNGEGERWHLSKSVPVSIIIFLVVQTIGAVWWVAKIDGRVDSLEHQAPIQDARITKLEEIGVRIAVMEDRQNNVIRRLEIQTDKLNQLISLFGAKRSSAPLPTDNP